MNAIGYTGKNKGKKMIKEMLKKEILTICPTRNRIEKCEQMWHSYIETSEYADIIFVVDDDDPDLVKYEAFFKSKEIKYYVRKQEQTTCHINYVFHMNKTYNYYHLTNDDFVYRTKGWDKMFINVFEDYGSGVAYGNDLYMGENLPTAPIISGDIARCLGWLQLPELNHLYGDNVWKVLAEGAKRLYYVKNIIIDHKHPFSRKHNVEKDETYLRTNSKAMYKHDAEAFDYWLKNNFNSDLEKIKNELDLEM